MHLRKPQVLVGVADFLSTINKEEKLSWVLFKRKKKHHHHHIIIKYNLVAFDSFNSKTPDQCTDVTIILLPPQWLRFFPLSSHDISRTRAANRGDSTDFGPSAFFINPLSPKPIFYG